MMKTDFLFLFALLFLLTGCIPADDPAHFALVRAREAEAFVVPDHPLSWQECRRMAPDAGEFSLHRLYIDAAAGEEAETLSSPGMEKHAAVLFHAKAKAALAAALGMDPGIRFSVEPLKEDWLDVPAEADLKAALWLFGAEKGIREPETVRRRELTLHCAYLDYLSLLEERDYGSAPSPCRAADLRRRGHLARLALLESIGEPDFSRIPLIRERVEKEAVREIKGL